MSEETSLYDRIGGEEGIANLIDSFYEKLLADPELKLYFEKIPVDKLQRMQREFFAMATGGPVIYSGRPLSQVHKKLGISGREFSRFTETLLSTLKEIESISHEDVLDVIARINLYSDEITNEGFIDG